MQSMQISLSPRLSLRGLISTLKLDIRANMKTAARLITSKYLTNNYYYMLYTISAGILRMTLCLRIPRHIEQLNNA